MSTRTIPTFKGDRQSDENDIRHWLHEIGMAAEEQKSGSETNTLYGWRCDRRE